MNQLENMINILLQWGISLPASMCLLVRNGLLIDCSIEQSKIVNMLKLLDCSIEQSKIFGRYFHNFRSGTKIIFRGTLHYVMHAYLVMHIFILQPCPRGLGRGYTPIHYARSTHCIGVNCKCLSHCILCASGLRGMWFIVYEQYLQLQIIALQTKSRIHFEM